MLLSSTSRDCTKVTSRSRDGRRKWSLARPDTDVGSTADPLESSEVSSPLSAMVGLYCDTETGIRSESRLSQES